MKKIINFTKIALASIFFVSSSFPSIADIKIGILHSLSGTLAISETTLKDTMLYLIDKQNAEGGINGEKLVPVVVDPASDWPLFAEKARELLTVQKVDVMFGCWTSVSRKSVLPVIEELNGLLFYPVQYEGEESSKNVFYTGAAPNQQAIPATDYYLEELGVEKFALLGTDYVYPRTTNKILNQAVFLANENGDELVAEDFFLLALMIPLMSGIADFLGNKKNFMKFFVYTGSFSCIALYFFDLNNIYSGIFFYLLALFSFWASLVFYNSYLPDIVKPEDHDRASALGYSYGYFGSVILLLFNIIMINFPDFFGFENSGIGKLQAMKVSFVTVGIWWLLFSQYSFYFLPSKKNNNMVSGLKKSIIFSGFNELYNVWIILKKNKYIKQFLIAFFTFQQLFRQLF